MAVDLVAWSNSVAADLAAAKDDFLSALEADKSFINTYDSYIVFDPQSMFRAPMTIALQGLDDLSSRLAALDYEAPAKPASLANPDLSAATGALFASTDLDGLLTSFSSAYSLLSGVAVAGGEGLDIVTKRYVERGLAQRRSDLTDRADALAARWAQSGYSTAPGALTKQISALCSEMDQQYAASLDGTYAKLVGAVQGNLQSAFENGIAIEKLHMDFTARYGQLMRPAIERDVEAFATEIRKRKQDVLAQMEALDLAIRSAQADHERDRAKVELELSEQSARLQQSITATASHIQAEADLIGKKVALASNIASGFQSLFTSYGSTFTGISLEQQSSEA